MQVIIYTWLAEKVSSATVMFYRSSATTPRRGNLARCSPFRHVTITWTATAWLSKCQSQTKTLISTTCCCLINGSCGDFSRERKNIFERDKKHKWMSFYVDFWKIKNEKLYVYLNIFCLLKSNHSFLFLPLIGTIWKSKNRWKIWFINSIKTSSQVHVYEVQYKLLYIQMNTKQVEIYGKSKIDFSGSLVTSNDAGTR